MPRLLTVVVAVAVLGVLAVLFVRSAQSSRETPFTVEQGSLAGWTLVVHPDAVALGSWLALSPPASPDDDIVSLAFPLRVRLAHSSAV